VEDFIGGGLSGQVFKVTTEDNYFAIKTFLPFYQLEAVPSLTASQVSSELLRLQAVEYQSLSKILHPNIVRVHDSDLLTLQGRESKILKNEGISGITSVPVIVMDYIEGSNLFIACEKALLTSEMLSLIFERLLKALVYLHANHQYMHVDIKAQNVMVRAADNEPILIDFSLSKNFDFAKISPDESTKLYVDRDLIPILDEDAPLRVMAKKGGPRKLLKEIAFPYLDYYQFGKMLQSLSEYMRRVYAPKQFEYIRLIAAQLTDWPSVIKLDQTRLLNLLQRLQRPYFEVFGVEELSEVGTTEETIQLPLLTAVPITHRMKQIIGTRSWRRLTTLNQLSLLGMVYPGADYKRSVHVLMAYHLARMILTRLHNNPLFRYIFDEKSIQQALVFVLLHDINHFPFLHTLQESGITKIDKFQVLDYFCSGERTGEKADKAPSIYDLADKFDITQARLKRVLFEAHDAQQSQVDCVIRSLIDSAIDVDKMSYLRLDAHFAGVPYGLGIDLPRLFQEATIGLVETADNIWLPHLAFRDGAIEAAESLVLARSWHFRRLYWHHKNRAIMAMVLRVARRLYEEKNLGFENYIFDTIHGGELEAMDYLNNKYYSNFHKNSILFGLREDDSRLYQRIFTMRAERTDGSDDATYEKARHLDLVGELATCERIARGIEELLGFVLGNIVEDEILIDIPRRLLEGDIGEAYIQRQSGTLLKLRELSAPTRDISSTYARMTNSIRCFVAPRISAALAEKYGIGYVERIRPDMHKIIVNAFREMRGGGQVR
jgi:HD superfamily phosphohydrolase